MERGTESLDGNYGPPVVPPLVDPTTNMCASELDDCLNCPDPHSKDARLIRGPGGPSLWCACERHPGLEPAHP